MQGGHQSADSNSKPFVLHKLFIRRGFSGIKDVPEPTWQEMVLQAKPHVEALQAKWPLEVQQRFNKVGVQLFCKTPEPEGFSEKISYKQDLGTPMFAYQAVLTFQVNQGMEVHDVSLRAASVIYHIAPLEQVLVPKPSRRQIEAHQAPPAAVPPAAAHPVSPAPFLPPRVTSAPVPGHWSGVSSARPNRKEPMAINLNKDVFENGPLSAQLSPQQQRPSLEAAKIEGLSSDFGTTSPMNRDEERPRARQPALSAGDAEQLAQSTDAHPASWLPPRWASAPAPVSNAVAEMLQWKSPQVEAFLDVDDLGRETGAQGSRIIWAVDSRKFDTQDKHVTSSSFKVHFGGRLRDCQIMLECTSANEAHGRQQCNFLKTNGKGGITLKCCDLDSDVDSSQQVAKVYFNIGAGDTIEPKRGPVLWHYDQDACCSLQKDEKEWDFKSAVVDFRPRPDLFRKVPIIVEIVPEEAVPSEATGGAAQAMPDTDEDHEYDTDDENKGAPPMPAPRCEVRQEPAEAAHYAAPTAGGPASVQDVRDGAGAAPLGAQAAPSQRPLGALAMQGAPQSQYVPTQLGRLETVPERRQQNQYYTEDFGKDGKKIYWRIAAKIFDTHNKTQTCPHDFKLTFPDGNKQSFRIILKPVDGEWKKRKSDFRTAEGKGNITVKCESVCDDAPQLEARIRLIVAEQESPWQDNDFKEFPSFQVKRQPGAEKGDVFSFFPVPRDPKAKDESVLLELWIEPKDTASSSSQAFAHEAS